MIAIGKTGCTRAGSRVREGGRVRALKSRDLHLLGALDALDLARLAERFRFIPGGLKPEPLAHGAAKRLGQPDGHFGRDPRAAVHELGELHPSDAERLGSARHAQPPRLKAIMLYDLSGVATVCADGSEGRGRPGQGSGRATALPFAGKDTGWCWRVSRGGLGRAGSRSGLAGKTSSRTHRRKRECYGGLSIPVRWREHLLDLLDAPLGLPEENSVLLDLGEDDTHLVARRLAVIDSIVEAVLLKRP